MIDNDSNRGGGQEADGVESAWGEAFEHENDL